MKVLMFRGSVDDLEFLGVFDTEGAALSFAAGRGVREVTLCPWSPSTHRLDRWSKVTGV